MREQPDKQVNPKDSEGGPSFAVGIAAAGEASCSGAPLREDDRTVCGLSGVSLGKGDTPVDGAHAWTAAGTSYSEIVLPVEYRALYEHCELCPRKCGVDRTRGERGVCGATDVLKLGRAALHWWEEPCLVGEQGSGAVFFSWCPMHCVYCQNRDLAAGDGIEVLDAQLERVFARL